VKGKAKIAEPTILPTPIFFYPLPIIGLPVRQWQARHNASVQALPYSNQLDLAALYFQP